MFTIIKILISAIIIGIVTEVSKRFPTYGGIIAALPLVSLLSLFWLYFQGEQPQGLSKFALGVLYGFPATAFLLFVVALSLKHSLPLLVSLGFGVGGWLVFLAAQNMLIKYIKVVL